MLQDYWTMKVKAVRCFETSGPVHHVTQRRMRKERNSGRQAGGRPAWCVACSRSCSWLLVASSVKCDVWRCVRMAVDRASWTCRVPPHVWRWDTPVKFITFRGVVVVVRKQNTECFDIVGSVYHLVIYVQCNKIHKVILPFGDGFFSSKF